MPVDHFSEHQSCNIIKNFGHPYIISRVASEIILSHIWSVWTNSLDFRNFNIIRHFPHIKIWSFYAIFFLIRLGLFKVQTHPFRLYTFFKATKLTFNAKKFRFLEVLVQTFQTFWNFLVNFPSVRKYDWLEIKATKIWFLWQITW